MTEPVRWSTKRGDFNINCAIKVTHLLPKLDSMKIVTWNFHVDGLHGNNSYYIILGRYILS